MMACKLRSLSFNILFSLLLFQMKSQLWPIFLTKQNEKEKKNNKFKPNAVAEKIIFVYFMLNWIRLWNELLPFDKWNVNKFVTQLMSCRNDFFFFEFFHLHFNNQNNKFQIKSERPQIKIIFIIRMIAFHFLMRSFFFVVVEWNNSHKIHRL